MCAVGSSSKTSIGGDASASTLLGSLSIGGTGMPDQRTVAAASRATLLTSPFGKQTAAPGAPAGGGGGGGGRRPPRAQY